MASGQESRRSPRIPFEELRTSMTVDGRDYPVQISDLSQEGVRLMVKGGVKIDPNQVVQIGVGKISPNVIGTVRWITRDEEDPGRMELGIEFDSFVIGQPEEDEVHGLLEAWQEISETYSLSESFWEILVMLDFEIMDGKIIDLSDSIFSIGVWMDQRLGPLNLWSVLKEPDGSLNCQLLVERHKEDAGKFEGRRAFVTQVSSAGMTDWRDGKAYYYGEDIVIEYLGEDQGQSDLLQRLGVILSRRIRFWSKLLMKNISLGLLGDEIERFKK